MALGYCRIRQGRFKPLTKLGFPVTVRFFWFVAKLAITIAAVYYLFSTQKLQLSELRILSDAWHWIPVAGTFVLIQMVIQQIRLWLLLRPGGVEISAYRVVRVGLISWFLNAALLGGLGFASGDAVRAAYLIRESGKPTIVLSAILADRVIGLIGLLTLACISLLVGFRAEVQTEAFGLVALMIYLPLVLVGIAIVLMVLSQFLGRVATLLGAFASCVAVAVFANMNVPDLPPTWTVGLMFATLGAAAPALMGDFVLSKMSRSTSRIGKFLADVLAAIAAYRNNPLSLFAGYMCALLSHCLSVTAIFVLAHGLELDVLPAFAEVLFAAPIAFLTSILPLPANGLGVGEIAFDTMLRLVRSPEASLLVGGAALYLAYRILNTLTALVGLPFFLSWKNQTKKCDEVLAQT